MWCPKHVTVKDRIQQKQVLAHHPRPVAQSSEVGKTVGVKIFNNKVGSQNFNGQQLGSSPLSTPYMEIIALWIERPVKSICSLQYYSSAHSLVGVLIAVQDQITLHPELEFQHNELMTIISRLNQ